MLACNSSGGVEFDWNPPGGISVLMMTICPALTAMEFPAELVCPEFFSTLASPKGVTETRPV
jgi:hypothetical protein